MNHIPATISMAKLYQAQGYFQDSKEIYIRVAKNSHGAESGLKKTNNRHKRNQNFSLPSSLEIKIDQWVTLHLLQRQTESWQEPHLKKAEKTK